MKRNFMIYQRRDGFQVAEIATETRFANGMEFLARPHKSACWCTAAFNIVIDDDYELVGEELIDCSRLPSQVICFVDGVLKTLDQSRVNIEKMIEQYDDAIEQCHAEALEMNKNFFELYYRYWRWWNIMDEYARADDLALAHKTALKINSLMGGA